MTLNGHEQPVTIDQLAAMTARGFQDVHEQLKLLATKDDLTELKTEVQENMQTMHKDIRGQLDLLIKTIRQNYESRLTRVEEEIKELSG